MLKRTFVVLGAAAAGLTGLASAVHGQLVVGVEAASDAPTAEPVQVYDLIRGTWRTLFTPADEAAVPSTDGVRGLAVDDVNGIIYFTSGDNLYRALYDPFDPLGPLSAVEKVDDLTSPGIDPSGTQLVLSCTMAQGELYVLDGQFGSPPFNTPIGIYRVDFVGPDAFTTLIADLNVFDGSENFNGFAYNDADGLFYITNDGDSPNLDGPGLYAVDAFNVLGGGVGAWSFVTAYPGTTGTSTDVDGLAIGDNKAYFVHDQPGEFGIWDFATTSFLVDTVPSPWTLSNLYAGGAWAPSLVTIPQDNDLVITMTDDPDPLPALNAPITYTITVTNDSVVATDNVVVTTNLDPSTTFSSTTGGGSHSAGVVTTSLGTMAPFASVIFEIVVLSTIETTAFADSTVTGTQLDPDPSDNVAGVDTLISLDADLVLDMVATPNPIVGLGSANFTYDITVENLGPLSADSVDVVVALDPGTTFVSSTAGSEIAGIVTATFAPIPSGGSVNFQIVASPNALGAFTATATASITTGPSSDPDPDNSTMDFVTAAVDALPYAEPEIIYTTVPSSPTSDVPGVPGRKFAVIDRPYQSPDGSRWIFKGITDDPDELLDEIIVAGGGTSGTTVVQESTLPEFLDEFDLIGSIDTMVSINDAGQFAFATNTDAPTDFDEVAVKWNGSSFVVVAREGNPVPVEPSIVYGTPIKYTSIQSDGTVSFDADTQASGSVDQFLMTNDGNAFLARELTTVPLNQPGGTTYEWDFWTGSDTPTSNFDYYQVDDTAANWLAVGDNTNPDTTIDEIATFNNSVYSQENTILPGSTFISPVESGSEIFRHYLSRRGGHYIARGANQDGIDWVQLDGGVVTTTFEPIHTGAAEVWTDVSVTRTHSVAVVSNNGDYVVGGYTDNADTGMNAVFVLNNQEVIYREGQPIDLDGNGVFDDNLFYWSHDDNDAFLTEDGWFYFTGRLKDGAGNVDVGQIFARVPVDLGQGCPCEFDGVEGVDIFDLLAYLDLWFAAAPGAEYDGTPPVDIFDLLGYLDCWFGAQALGGDCPI